MAQHRFNIASIEYCIHAGCSPKWVYCKFKSGTKYVPGRYKAASEWVQGRCRMGTMKAFRHIQSRLKAVSRLAQITFMERSR